MDNNVPYVSKYFEEGLILPELKENRIAFDTGIFVSTNNLLLLIFSKAIFMSVLFLLDVFFFFFFVKSGTLLTYWF